MAWRYTWHNNPGGTDCYKSAIMHARMLAKKQRRPILLLYHGPQTKHPRNRTADPRKVSSYFSVDGSQNFAHVKVGNLDYFVEPMGAKGLTWK